MKKLFLIILASIFILGGCVINGPNPDQSRSRVKKNLNGLSKGLQSGTWEKVDRFFSSDYYGGRQEIQDKVERRMRDQNLTNLNFTINRVLETDDKTSVDVRWNKSWIDSTGQPHKQTGTSEILLVPRGKSYKIIDIKGDSFY